jgi:xanthine dehydrogenase accessory factor
MKSAILERVLKDRAAKQAVVLVTELQSGAQVLVYRREVFGDLTLDGDALVRIRESLEADESGTLELGGKRLFLQVQNPPLRLIIIGAVHIAQTLAPMAALAGYTVAIVDPRRAFATDARFPDVKLIGEWPDEAMATMKLDRRTAVVTLTHDPTLDDPALQTALKADVFYVGALGSRKTHAAQSGIGRSSGLATPTARAYMGPSASTSARCRRPRSPSRSWRKSRRSLRRPSTSRRREKAA